MPIIDIYIPEDVIPAETSGRLTQRLVTCLVRHEGFGDPAPDAIRRISTGYVHRLPSTGVHTLLEENAKVVRLHVTYHPGGLNTASMRAFIKEATDIVADVAGDAELRERTWVTLCETVEGGWGVDGKSVRDKA